MKTLLHAFLSSVMFFLSSAALHCASQASEMVFQSVYNGGNCSDCSWISAIGDITGETPEQFDLFLRDNPDAPSLLRIHSSGGNLIAAIRLGSNFRKHKIDVEVASTAKYVDTTGTFSNLHVEGEGDCYSACVLALAGARYRFVYDLNDKRARIGVHRFFLSEEHLEANQKVDVFGGFETAQLLSGLVVGYLLEMGVAPDLFVRMSEVTSDSIELLTRNELVEYGLINTQWEIGAWSIDLTASQPTARATSTYGGSHHASLEYKCKIPRRGYLQLSIQLPSNAQFLASSKEVQMSYLAADRVELTVDTSNDPFAVAVQKSSIQSGSVVAEFFDSQMFSELRHAREVQLSYMKSMVASRQYDTYDMLHPTFSLENFFEAVDAVDILCREKK